jgi:hypothetical protein
MPITHYRAKTQHPVPGTNLSDCVAKALSADQRWGPFNRYRCHGHGHNLATGRGERETTL